MTEETLQTPEAPINNYDKMDLFLIIVSLVGMIFCMIASWMPINTTGQPFYHPLTDYNIVGAAFAICGTLGFIKKNEEVVQ